MKMQESKEFRDFNPGHNLGFPSEAIAKTFCKELSQRHGIQNRKIEELCHRARWLDESISDLILREGILSDIELRDLLSIISGFPVVSLVKERISREVIQRVPVTTVSKCNILPIKLDGEKIVLVSDRIVDHDESERLRVLLGSPIEWVLCTSKELSASIKYFYGVGLQSFLDVDGQKRKGDDKEAGVETSPGMSGFVGQLLDDAILANATDIHIEPREDGISVRFRIDGILYPITVPVGIEKYRRAIVSSIKVMAQLNIAERRLPQDGRFTRVAGDNAYDIRVSVLPARHGETLSLRILNRRSTFLNLGELGLADQQHAELENLIDLTHGILLFTGPTGSGKTTSLYASLAKLNTEERKIVTLEDPIEYDIAGITQLQVQTEIGFTFPSGLRSILRHDPDVILIGEIRDSETARIAVGSSLTGHLVLSTLHTQNAASAIIRLTDMGVEPYLVAASVQGMVSQRLLRKICDTCREEYFESPNVEKEITRLFPERISPIPFYRGPGCPNCRYIGYSGRQAVFEVLPMNEALRRLVIERVPTTAFVQHALSLGFSPLRRNAWQCALEGTTTVSDVLRITRRPSFQSQMNNNQLLPYDMIEDF